MDITDLKPGLFLRSDDFSDISPSKVVRVHDVSNIMSDEDFMNPNHIGNESYDTFKRWLCVKVKFINKRGAVTYQTMYKESLENAEIISFDEYRRVLDEINREALMGIEQYIDILRNVFPGKVVTQKEDDGFIYSYILIDEETVRSSNRVGSTVIRDFVFRLKYAFDPDSNKYLLSSVNGQIFRATRSQASFQYAHSHVTSSGAVDWGNCCFGGGTALNQTYNTLRLGLEPIKFQLFMYQLKDFLKHESLKGGPFRRISNLNTASTVRFIADHSELHNIHCSMDTHKVEVCEKDGTIRCSFDRDALSRQMISIHSLNSNRLGYMVDGNFVQPNVQIFNSRNIDRYLEAPGLNVSDDVNTISLTKTLHGEELPSIDTETAQEYVDPKFMDAYEKKYIGLYESIILSKILDEERSKTKINSESGSVSQSELPAFIDG